MVPVINSLDPVGHVVSHDSHSVLLLQVTAALDTTEMNGCGGVPIKLYLQNT
jgi:hypothetical protein